jgi:hypothetical protein
MLDCLEIGKRKMWENELEDIGKNMCIVCHKNKATDWCFWCQHCIDEEKFIEENLK